MSETIRRRRACVALVTLCLALSASGLDARPTDRDRDTYNAARSRASQPGADNLQKAYQLISTLVDRRNPLDEHLYLAALLECKRGERSKCIERCDQLLKMRTTRFRGQALKLRTLANSQNEQIRSQSRANLTAPTAIYATALENHRRFVDAGYNNVAGRVLDARRRTLDQPRPRLVTEKAAKDALAVFTGHLDPGAVQVARVQPAATTVSGSDDSPAATKVYQPAEARPDLVAPPAADIDFKGVFEFDDGAFQVPAEIPVEAPPQSRQPSVTPVAATPTLEQPDPFADFSASTAKVPTLPSQPTPTTAPAAEAMTEHMRPIAIPTVKPATPATKKPEPVKSSGDEFGEAFAEFGDTEEPKKPETKKPEPQKPEPRKPEPRKPEPKKPEPKKPEPAKAGADEFGDAFAEFGADEGDTKPAPPVNVEPAKPVKPAQEPPKTEPAKGDDDDFDAFEGF